LRRSLGRDVASLAFALSCANACANVLGVTGSFDSVTVRFCKCDVLDSRWPKDYKAAEFYACEEYVGAALDAESPEAHAWIAAFEQGGCDDGANSLACAQLPPLCIAIGGGPCADDSSCCGYDPARPTASYCGYVLDEAGTTVVDRRCVADSDPDGCSKSGEPCMEDAHCCGSAGSLATCPEEAGFCFAQCDPENQILCPGCCAFVNFGGPGEEFPACVGGLPYDPMVGLEYCNQVCFASCPLGLGCGEVDRQLEFIDVNGDPRFANITVTECIALPD